MVSLLTVFVLGIMGLGIWAIRKQRARRRKYVGPDGQRFRGSLTERIGLNAEPRSGRGYVIIGREGMYFNRTDSWGGGGGTTWDNIVTFARNSRLLQIEWRRDSVSPGDYAAIQFKTRKGVEVEQLARKHLDPHRWRQQADLGVEGNWDAFWSSLI